MKHILIILFSTLYSVCLTAQTYKGLVLDRYGAPVQDAYIANLNDTEHTHSNAQGIFIFQNAQTGDTLEITLLGFQPAQVVVPEQFSNQPVKVFLKDAFFDLDQVVISNDLRAVNQVSKIDLIVNPVNSSQDVLRKVPGLFIGQHAGGGKAEQLFLRGFDIDHGTDVGIKVDGMPVNMVSHAHGQGYADLHFLIPETVERLDFGKGPYYADEGNFTTAGYVSFHTKESLDKSSIGLEYGSFNSLRALGLFNLLGKVENQNAYLATDLTLADGPFESPQNLNRINLFGKYSINLAGNDKLWLEASYFRSTWDASGQIPQRAVDSGMIDRFGAIDDTEGGNTSRANLLVGHTKAVSENTLLKNQVYFVNYDFELFSNFTFFLNDPVNGDQIHQKEQRNIFGLETSIQKDIRPSFAERLDLKGGIGFRYDLSNDNELSHTLNRSVTLDTLSFGDVAEANYFAYANAEFDFGKWLINPGLRLDYFNFEYSDQLANPYNTSSSSKAIVSPKLNIIYNPSSQWQFYGKTGIGFHSNDSRVVVARQGNAILPAAFGADLGLIWKPIPRIWINVAGWYLFLEQEFVYVGDEGIVEPSGRSGRLGADFGIRYQILDWLFIETDANYSFARSLDEPEGANRIPLAPVFTGIGGISFDHPSGFKGGLKGRYMADRPANEDESITAEGYFIADLNINYQFRAFNLGLIIENLFDNEWNETQFATESRLRDEVSPVEEIHFTPGAPFNLKGKITYSF